MQLNATSPIKMPRPYGGDPPIICAKPIDSVGHYEITIQLCGVIEKTSQFIEVFEVLANAQQGDEIRIVIDTPGGNVFATQLLVDYMTRCKANVTTVASGLVASAGTIVWFYGKQREVGPWAKFMFHGTSHGAFGRTSEIKEEAEQLVKFMETLLKDMVAAGIITTEEYEKITSCKQDTYVTGEAMRKRLFAAMQATESFNILKSQEEGEDGEGKGSDKGEGSDTKEDPEKGSGSGKKEGEPEGEPAAPEGKKKAEGEEGDPDEGSGKKEGDEPAKEPEADPDKGSGSDKKEGEPEGDPEAPANKKKAEGEDGEDPEADPDKGSDGGESDAGAGEKEHGEDCDCDDCKAKKAKKNEGEEGGEPGEGDPAAPGEGEPEEGEVEDAWCADSYVG